MIPRSGVAGAQVRCFSVYIEKVGDPTLMVQNMAGGDLNCTEWNGQSYDKPVTLPLMSIEAKDISVMHYYGYDEIKYRGLMRFVLSQIFFLPYAKIHLIRAVESLDQYFFNKKKLFTRQRIELLQFIVQRKLDGAPGTGAVFLMSELYSTKWIYHPDKDKQLKRLKFYLESLTETGELRYADFKYEPTGEALKAIEVYEEQERKHTENVKIQRRMIWLTLAIALLTGAQASLYKLPTLIDWSESKPILSPKAAAEK